MLQPHRDTELKWKGTHSVSRFSCSGGRRRSAAERQSRRAPPSPHAQPAGHAPRARGPAAASPSSAAASSQRARPMRASPRHAAPAPHCTAHPTHRTLSLRTTPIECDASVAPIYSYFGKNQLGSACRETNRNYTRVRCSSCRCVSGAAARVVSCRERAPYWRAAERRPAVPAVRSALRRRRVCRRRAPPLRASDLSITSFSRHYYMKGRILATVCVRSPKQRCSLHVVTK